VLRETVARCEAGTGSECALIEALSSESRSARPIIAIKGGSSGSSHGEATTTPVATPRAGRRPARRSPRRAGARSL